MYATYTHVSDAGRYLMGHSGYAAALSLQRPKGHCLTRSDPPRSAGNARLANTSISFLFAVLSPNQQAHNTLFSYILDADC